MAKLTFWFDLASNYSYLSAMRIEGLCREAGLDLAWQPFLLGPIFRQEGWTTSPFNIYAAKGAYMRRDMARLTEQRGLPPFTLPPDFPQNSLLAARIAMIGQESPWIGDYVRAVFTRQFGTGLGIEDPAVHVALLNDLGVDGDSIVARAGTDPAVKAALKDATDRAIETGIFGAPTFETEDREIFWGDDRLPHAIDWARKPRSP